MRELLSERLKYAGFLSNQISDSLTPQLESIQTEGSSLKKVRRFLGKRLSRVRKFANTDKQTKRTKRKLIYIRKNKQKLGNIAIVTGL